MSPNEREIQRAVEIYSPWWRVEFGTTPPKDLCLYHDTLYLVHARYGVPLG